MTKKKSILKLVKVSGGYEPIEQTGNGVIHFTRVYKTKAGAQKRLDMERKAKRLKIPIKDRAAWMKKQK